MASDDLYASGVEAAGLNSRLTAMLTAFLVVTLGSVIGVRGCLASLGSQDKNEVPLC